MTSMTLKDFVKKIADLEEAEVLSAVKSRLNNGDDPFSIIEQCQIGMAEVGRRYEKGEYFISSLIVAGVLFREVAELVHPLIEKKMEGKNSRTILLGTVHGDIHDLGKNLFGMLMTCHGFRVYDIGVDVSPDEFERQAVDLKPDIIGLSGLLTVSFEAMKDTVGLLKKNPDRRISETPIIIGSSLLKPHTRDYIGADYWTDSAMSGIRICKQIIKDRQKSA